MINAQSRIQIEQMMQRGGLKGDDFLEGVQEVAIEHGLPIKLLEDYTDSRRRGIINSLDVGQYEVNQLPKGSLVDHVQYVCSGLRAIVKGHREREQKMIKMQPIIAKEVQKEHSSLRNKRKLRLLAVAGTSHGGMILRPHPKEVITVTGESNAASGLPTESPDNFLVHDLISSNRIATRDDASKVIMSKFFPTLFPGPKNEPLTRRLFRETTFAKLKRIERRMQENQQRIGKRGFTTSDILEIVLGIKK